LYNISLSSWTGPNVWRYIAALILEFEGRNATVRNINDYLDMIKEFRDAEPKNLVGVLSGNQL
jgi:hypothetical protein